MKKAYSLWLSLLLCLGVLSSCEDKLSPIGEGIQPQRDVVESEKYFLQFEARTVSSPTLYSGVSPTVLLGAYSDPTYGSFSADFAVQFRTAPGIEFSNLPEGGQIDSVRLELIFDNNRGVIGSTIAPIQFSVYELPSDFSGSDTSTPSLAEYAVPSRLLGEQVVSRSADVNILSSSKEDGVTIAGIYLKLKPELGQRIYEASKQRKADFDTQESFNQKVFAGVYVTPSTGRGFVIKPTAIRLMLFYHYKDKEGKDVVGRRGFLNTKLTAKRNGLSSENLTTLLAPNEQYTYSKGPAGVQTALRLSKEQMQRLLTSQKGVKIGENWTLADTQLSLRVDNPDGVLLNPPTYMMLIPKDSLSTYFRQGHTERSAIGSSYLSSAYSSQSQEYDFHNISQVITKHLQKHAKYNGSWTIDQDLELRLVPVERTVTQASRGGNVQTVAIDEYLFPTFVRLRTEAKALKIGVTTSIFK